VPLPDADGRARLLELYRGGLDLDLSGAENLIERTAGVTASFIKELIRRAALIAADDAVGEESASATGSATASSEASADPAVRPLHVTADHLDQALDILAGSRHQLTRRLLGAPDRLEG